jgi:hypothetical protein
MKVLSKFNAFADDLDWFLLRQYPTAWHWRADYFVLCVLTGNILALLATGSPHVGGPAVITYSIIVANVWVALAFASSDHVYNSNVITPLLLAMFIVTEPLALPLGGIFSRTGLTSVSVVAVVALISLYFNKLLMFSRQPKPFNPEAFRVIGYMTLGFFLFLSTIEIWDYAASARSKEIAGITSVDSNSDRSTSIPRINKVKIPINRPDADARSVPVDGVPDAPIADVPGLVQFIFSVFPLGFLELIPGGPWTVAVLMVLAVALIMVRGAAKLGVPLLDLSIYKRLFLGSSFEEPSEDLCVEIIAFSFAIPFIFLILSFLCAAMIPEYLGGLAFIVFSLIFVGFVFLQARSFQPYLNEFRARISSSYVGDVKSNRTN